MRHPAVPPALGLVTGVAIGWRRPEFGAIFLVVLVTIAWLCAVIVGARVMTRFVTPVTMAAFLLAGVLLGAQATRDATRPPLWLWYEQRRADMTRLGPVVVEGRLLRDATPTRYGASLTLAVHGVRTVQGFRLVDGGARVAVGGQLTSSRIGDWVEGRHVRMPVTFRESARYLNPGVPDQQRTSMWGGTSLLGSVKSALLVDVVDAGEWWSEAAAAARARVRERVERTVGRFDRRSAGVVTAVLIGDRAGLEPDDRRRLQEGGTYHVIAISGGNIAILSGVLILVFRVSGCGRRSASVATVVCVVAYAAIVGSEASVTRATFAASLFLLARAFDHRISPLNTLGLSAACLVAFSPLTILDPGFLLTFGATLGLLVGVAPAIERMKRVGGRLPSGIRVVAFWAGALLVSTVCAELALFPVAATVFSRVTVAGLVLNFAAIPLMTIAQIAGMLAVALGSLWEAGARVAGYVAHLSASGIVESARLMDLFPWLSRRVPAPPLAVVAAYYTGWCACLSRTRVGSIRIVGLASVVVSGALILGGPLPRLTPYCRGTAPMLRVLFLDVGQADATLVTTPSGRSLLVDAAGDVRGAFDVGGRVVSPVVWHAGIRRLDVLALTHGDPDHIGGALSVMADLHPREVWEGVPVPSSNALRALQEAATEAGVRWRTVHAGDVRSWGDVTLRVVHPPPPDWERQEVRNDDSLVLELRYRDVSIVLPGDVGAEVEPTLVGAFGPAAFRVVKVPHHGSRTSSTVAFVDALQPDLAVVSAGRNNPFGHPHPEVLQRYIDAGARVLQTGEAGAITVCTDGRVVHVKTRR